jgi:hypothetical protein
MESRVTNLYLVGGDLCTRAMRIWLITSISYTHQLLILGANCILIGSWNSNAGLSYCAVLYDVCLWGVKTILKLDVFFSNMAALGALSYEMTVTLFWDLDLNWSTISAHHFFSKTSHCCQTQGVERYSDIKKENISKFFCFSYPLFLTHKNIQVI